MRTHAASLCLLAVMALGACGSAATDSNTATSLDAPTSSSPEPSSAPPDGEPTRTPSTEPAQGGRLMPLGGSKPDVRWTPNGLEVRAFGSSTCPPVARDVEVVDSFQVVIDVTPKSDGVCTDDLAPNNSWVPAPQELDTDQPLTVRLRNASVLSAPIRVRFLDNTAL